MEIWEIHGRAIFVWYVKALYNNLVLISIFFCQQWLYRRGVRRVYYSLGDSEGHCVTGGTAQVLAGSRASTIRWRMLSIEALLAEPAYVTKGEQYVGSVRGVHLRV